jgi:hypothetical protein
LIFSYSSFSSFVAFRSLIGTSTTFNKFGILDLKINRKIVNISNNYLNNLQWSTHFKNEQDKEYVLSDEQVIKIKNRLLEVKNYGQVANEFKILNITVSQIAREITYKGIGPNLSNYNFDSRHILTDNERQDIKNMLKRQERVVDIMKKHNICRAHVYRIKNNEMSY